MTEMGRGAEKARRETARDGGARRQSRDRADPRRIAQRPPCEVVVGPRVLEAELLCSPPDRLRVCPPVLRQDDGAQPQAPSCAGVAVADPDVHRWRTLPSGTGAGRGGAPPPPPKSTRRPRGGAHALR